MFIPNPKYVESAAYHEAGHTVVAAALDMPLRPRGTRVDSMGLGISYYWFRVPGDLGNTELDRVERERTIISTEAGFAAQRRFYPDCPHGGNWADKDLCNKLLDEMYSNRPKWVAEQARLLSECERILLANWNAVLALGAAVLQQPLVPRLGDDDRQWSDDKVARHLFADKIVDIVNLFGLPAYVADESKGTISARATPTGII